MMSHKQILRPTDFYEEGESYQEDWHEDFEEAYPAPQNLPSNLVAPAGYIGGPLTAVTTTTIEATAHASGPGARATASVHMHRGAPARQNTVQQMHQPVYSSSAAKSSSDGAVAAKIDIICDQTIAVAGGFVTGLVEIKAESTCELRELLIALIGTEALSGKERRETQIIALRDVLSRLTPVLPGKTTFNFAFTLPDNIPSSFRSSHGDVTYSIEVAAKFSTARLTSTKEITIYENIASEFQNATVSPRSVTASGSKSFFLAGSGTVNATATLSRSLYSSGSPIIVSILVENHTKKRMPFIKMQLVRLMSIGSAPDLEKVVESVSFNDRTVKVESGESRSLILHMDSIPPLLTSISQTTLFQVKYSVQLTLDGGSFMSRPLTVSLPIRIAHAVSCTPSLIPSYIEPANRPAAVVPRPSVPHYVPAAALEEAIDAPPAYTETDPNAASASVPPVFVASGASSVRVAPSAPRGSILTMPEAPARRAPSPSFPPQGSK
ncbi:hypothetical protein CAOG_03562 [Capsaspora owczarzaki ATCC 30864]|uniref:Arrestin C-terminal-like domain-containing protein n=1 Tax=Capsaspora owczarzaki (strain ATCC 30864) TaxID=595528 RepID=A0A0D2VQ25_CAPO3|nr:hypothetical protein CAOG_03562 [Capsaspora owczarzaki ATCC 30864]KJE92642.1 hypothetical protein CAOG_003562 [Capsaspora owczarzaki ATCC 30864]|eukprot:XP_004363290.2 hypothetical protein CAOG_03562 [Capsaspora owczarzaki ATCC 30864]